MEGLLSTGPTPSSFVIRSRCWQHEQLCLCLIYTLHRTLHSVHCQKHTAHCILHFLHCTLHTEPRTMHDVQWTMNNARCTINSAHLWFHLTSGVKMTQKHTSDDKALQWSPLDFFNWRFILAQIFVLQFWFRQRIVSNTVQQFIKHSFRLQVKKNINIYRYI